MLDRSRMVASLVFFAAVAAQACGAESPSTPGASSSQTTTVITGSGFGGAPIACIDFNNAKSGAVTAIVTPPSIHLVLRAGSCSTPGQTLAAKDTELLNVNAPAGSNNVTMSNPNPSGPDTPYTLRLTHWQ